MPMTGGPSDTMLPPDIIPAVPPPPVVVLVGELNPYGTNPRYALYDEPTHSAGGRLRRLVLGLNRRTYFGGQIERGNLCTGRWSDPVARERAAIVLAARPASTLILLGRKVATAFGFGADGPFTVSRIHPRTGATVHVVLLPHPSGLCREWGKPGAVERARELLRREVPAIPWGEVDAAPADPSASPTPEPTP